jgi:predicted protein tyrosine phosphatase
MTREPIFLPGKTFQVLGRAEAMRVLPEEKYIHISITAPDAPEVALPENTNRLAVLRLSFHDTDTASIGITQAQAEEIVAFVRKYKEHHPEVGLIVCNCEAGLSRSAGVAAALAKWLTGEDAPFFMHFLPNSLVYRRVLEAAMASQ